MDITFEFALERTGDIPQYRGLVEFDGVTHLQTPDVYQSDRDAIWAAREACKKIYLSPRTRKANKTTRSATALQDGASKSRPR